MQVASLMERGVVLVVNSEADVQMDGSGEERLVWLL